MSLRKKSQDLLLKASPVYRRLTRIMHAVDASFRRQQRAEVEILETKGRVEQLQATLVRLENTLVSLKEEVFADAGSTRQLITATTDIATIPKSSGALRDIQDISLEMLCEIDRICKNTNSSTG